MDKPKILIVDKPCSEAERILETEFDLVNQYENYDDCIGVFVGLTKLTPSNYPKNLKVIGCPCTGIDHITSVVASNIVKIIHLDQEWKATEGQKITSTAEHTLSLMLQLAKKKKMQLLGKTIGIIGCEGRIGSKMKNISYALNMRVMGIDEEFMHVDKIVIRSKIKDFDIITLHVPLNDETCHMIGKKEIEQMKDGSLLINTSRQEVVDIDAVKEAVISGKIYYADDFRNNVDLTMYGAIQTDHIGGNCIEARESTDIYIAKQFVNYIKSMGE